MNRSRGQEPNADEMLARFIDIARSASAVRQLCVGGSLEIDHLLDHEIEGDNKADFDGVVTVLYKMWNETWKQDVEFFSARGSNDSRVRGFSELIIALRTAAQHADNSRVQDIYRQWTRDHGGSPFAWARCITELLDAAIQAIGALEAAMSHARSDINTIERWRESETVSARSSVAAVAQDLGLCLSPGQLQRHSRDVDKRLRMQPPKARENLQMVVDSYSMQQLISLGWSKPVSVDYYSLLEDFGLVAHPDSRDFLRLAHVVESVTRTSNRRDDFVRILKQSWSFLVKHRR